MKIKKVRGHCRLQKQIITFFKKQMVSGLDLQADLEYEYIKFRIWPWSGVTTGTETKPAEPKGKTREIILMGFLDIYDVWKKQLDSMNEPYYLKIWFYSPNVSKSQIVCATKNRLNWYDGMFFSPAKTPEFNLSKNKILNNRLTELNWEYFFDEEFFDNTTLGEIDDYKSLADYYSHKNWIEKQLRKPHRTTLLNDPIDGCTEYYSFKKGDLWVGG